MAKKSRAQKIQESALVESTPKKHLSKYALKKLAQQNSWQDEPITNAKAEDSQELSTTSDNDQSQESSSGKSKNSTTRLSLRNKHSNNKNNSASNEDRRQAQAKAKAIKAALEGASGIEKADKKHGNKKTVSFSRKGNVITVVRKGPKLSPHQEAKALEHKAKLIKHAKDVRQARNEALAKLEAQGKTYQKPHRDPEAIPDKVNFDRKVVETCGVQIKDRLPNLTDLSERQAAMMPHNRRDQMLFAPIKRETKPIKGTDFMVKFLDSWSRRNDTQGIFTSLFEQVKAVRQNENGIAYIGLPAFLKFLEGASKNQIIEDYAFDFRQFIKRREITDFIGSMQKAALDWAKHRPALEPYYAFVYFDTYPVHIKLGKKRVINVQVLFILGITLDGRKDILGIVPDLNSSRVSVSFWDSILGHLKTLGCQEICFIVAAFKCRYLERSVKNFFPNATMHFNLLELLQFDSFSVPQEMRAQFMEDAHLLTESSNYDESYEQLLKMRSKWERHMREGETILQGSLDYLKTHTLLNVNERKIFTSQKIVSQAASLLMGNKADDDFFSDNAEMLTYFFYRYLLIGKQYWIEHQDYAVNNLSFAKIFSQLRHLDISGAHLLNKLLYERHQEFMYRHFGQFGNGPVFNLNPNKKRISLSGQIDDNAAIRGDVWNDKSNAALNTAHDHNEIESKECKEVALKSPEDIHNSKVEPKDSEAPIKDIEGSDLTLNANNNDLKLGNCDNLFESEVKLNKLSLDSCHIFSMDTMHSYESNAFRALGGLDIDQSLPAFLQESCATLTLNNSSSNFLEKREFLEYDLTLNNNHQINKVNSKPSKLAVALRFEYPKFKHYNIVINGQEYLISYAALGDLDQDKINDQVLHHNSDIKGIDKVDGTFGFKILRSKRLNSSLNHNSKQVVKNNHALVVASEQASQDNNELNASYSRHFKDTNTGHLYQVGEQLKSLKYQYDNDSAALLKGMGKVNLNDELNHQETSNQSQYLDSVSSNIQRANAVLGMLRPSIAQALRKDRLDLKQKYRELITLCLGSNFNFDEINNVIHQITPIFRSAMQNKLAMKNEKEQQKKAQERQRKKEKARELYLKRQAKKAQLQAQEATMANNELTDKYFEPLSADDFNPLNCVDESSALATPNSQILGNAITLTDQGLSVSNDNSSELLVTNSSHNLSLQLNDATSLNEFLASHDNDEGKLTLIKPADAKVAVVANEYRNTIAQKMAIQSTLGVKTQKPDHTIKTKE